MPTSRSGDTEAELMMAAGTRLRESWLLANLDAGEMHEAALGLISVTGAADLRSAPAVLHDVESETAL